ncbi:MAG: glycosyltransferase [Anaerolineales bacterium]
MSSIFLSIVIPVYNEESRLPKTFEKLFSFLQEQPYQAEVIIVEMVARTGPMKSQQHTLENTHSLRC